MLILSGDAALKKRRTRRCRIDIYSREGGERTVKEKDHDLHFCNFGRVESVASSNEKSSG